MRYWNYAVGAVSCPVAFQNVHGSVKGVLSFRLVPGQAQSYDEDRDWRTIFSARMCEAVFSELLCEKQYFVSVNLASFSFVKVWCSHTGQNCVRRQSPQ